MKFIILLLSTVVLAMGCSSAPVSVEKEKPTELNIEQLPMRQYSRNLADQLFASAVNVKAGQQVAVTSLTWLDSNLNRSPLVALQLQEELASELHAMSLNVLEFKLTDGIRVTPNGDFALSRNYLELAELQAADYILTGTLVERSAGLVVNLRLIDFNSRVLRATAQTLIPNSVVRTLRDDAGIEIVGAR